VDVVRSILTVWDGRKWVIACTTIVTLLGILYALFAKPIYHAEAVIALKEEEKGNATTRALAQLGGLGGSVAGQLGLTGTSLDLMQITLMGHELAEAVITENDLMPKLFPKIWDSAKKTWTTREAKKVPTLRQGVGVIRKSMVVNIDQKKRVLTLGININDSQLAKQLVDVYLAGLNEKLRLDVMEDADSNQKYLEKQLDNTVDPALREKINGLIAYQIEKKMLMSSSAFNLLERPVVPLTPSSPDRKKIVIVCFLTGFLFSVASIFAWKAVLGLRVALIQENNGFKNVEV